MTHQIILQNLLSADTRCAILCQLRVNFAAQYSTLGYLYKESSDIGGPKFVKQNGVQILSIEKTQVFTMHE